MTEPLEHEQAIIAAMSSLEMATGWIEQNWPTMESFDADEIREMANRLYTAASCIDEAPYKAKAKAMRPFPTNPATGGY
jgi:hypothetical protein